MDCVGFDSQRRRRRCRRYRHGNGNRRSVHFPRQSRFVCHRRRRPYLCLLHQCLYEYRRRLGYLRARRHSVGRHGILAIPPDRRGGRRRADYRRRTRRRRHPVERAGRALYGTLCSDRERFGFARRGFPRYGDGDLRRPRLRSEQRPRFAENRPHRRRKDYEQTAGHPRDFHSVCRHRPD